MKSIRQLVVHCTGDTNTVCDDDKENLDDDNASDKEDLDHDGQGNTPGEISRFIRAFPK